jgi:4-amino-4-deoxy-L-arabinose transferase-like glycosyltransferase
MNQTLRAAAIALAAAVVLLSALGRADLFNPDEPREAEMAREMWHSGRLLVPHLNGTPFLEKPPLFYWLVLGAYRVAGGPGEASSRAVPAIAGCLCVLLLYLFGRDMVGERGAALAALVLLTAFLFFWTSRRCMIDMPLTLAVLIACGALHRGVVLGGRARLAWLAAGYLAIGAAVMFKGIVGAGIPGLALAGFIVARRDWRGVIRHGLLPGTALALVPLGIWVAALYRSLGPAAAWEFVWVNNVLRFTGGAGRGHENPFYYYLPTLLTDFAPWSLVLPVALLAAWAAARGRGEGAALPERQRSSLLYIIGWFVLPFLVLSIASTKRGIYLLPIFPAAALLIGWWLAGLGSAATADGRPAAPPGRAARVTLGLLFGGIIVMSAGGLLALRLARPADFVAPIGLALLLAALGVAGFPALRAGRGERFGAVAATMVGLLFLTMAHLVIPDAVQHWATGRPAAAELQRVIDGGDHLVLYRFKEGAIGNVLYYLKTTLPNLRTPEALRAHLAALPAPAPGPIAVALMYEDVYRSVLPDLGIPTTIVRRLSNEKAPLIHDTRDALVLVAAQGGLEPARADR